MPVPNSFANVTTSIPLSQLDANFNTPITLGNTAIQLGNTVTTLNNMTLANVTISSGNVTLTNVTVTTANVTTANITTAVIATGNVTTGNITNLISGNVAITGGSVNGTTLGASNAASANVTTLTTSSTVTVNGGTANTVQYLNASKVMSSSANLTFDGTTLGAAQLAVNSNNISAVNSLGFRNRIINGDMRIDQRNAGASVSTGTAGTYVYTLDRWAYYASVASKYTVQQNAGSVTPPVGYTNYLGVTSTSAYSVGASEQFNINHRIEGFNTADLAWGTASAQTVTLSFWVRSSLTGSFGGFITNSGAARFYPFSFSISSANTWEQKTVTISGDTTGTWLTNNGTGIWVSFSLGAGSSVSGTGGAWTSSSFLQPTGSTSVVGTNGATFYITGVQLEAGSVATPFERRDYGRELMMCQRYFQLITAQTVLSRYSSTNEFSAMPFALPVTMRATGTISATTSQARYYDAGGTATNTTTIIGSNPTVTGGNIIVRTTSILAQYQSTAGEIAGGASISSEL